MLAFTVLIPLVASAASSGILFRDVPDGAWYAAPVRAAVSAGIVSGYKDGYGNLTGTFGPENQVTLGEGLKIALESAGYDSNLGVGYGHWAAKYLSLAMGLRFQIAQQQGINLDRAATRGEVASMFSDAFRVVVALPQSQSFSDVEQTNQYAPAIAALSRDKVISGDTDSSGNPTGTFRPSVAINRAETVKIAMAARTLYGLPGKGVMSSSAASSGGACSIQNCGVAPLMPNWQCGDNTIGGPSCQKLPDGRCGWLIVQCAMSSSRSSSSFSSKYSSSSAKSFAVTILYTDNGFTPAPVHIKVGQTVMFKNATTGDMWVASNPHPTHTDYRGFDSGRALPKDGEYTFTFTKTGTWSYHNHVDPAKGGQVVVDQ